MTLRELLREGEASLSLAGIDDAGFDARELLFHVYSLDRERYLSESGREAEERRAEEYRELIRRRAEHTPLQHLTGEAWFYGYRFSVGPEVLIPRFDTEVLLERALRVTEELTERKRISEDAEESIKVLDLCTGSGILACVLSLEGKRLSVTASDISPAALATARKNAADLKAEAEFLESDLFEEVPGCFDVIVSNPPYIAPEVIETLSPEVREHDPVLALDGGEDGLEFYRRIAREAPKHLKPGGRLLLEIGEEQGKAVTGLLSGAGFINTAVFKDLSGLDRVVSAEIGTGTENV